MNFISFNGRQVSQYEPVLDASNRAFKYGDGLFETIRVVKGEIPLADYHFKRLFRGMNQLKIARGILTREFLTHQILELCQTNNCLVKSRVRLQIFRNNDNTPGFIIEAVDLPDAAKGWDEIGYNIDIFPGASKSADELSNLKSSNFLPYVMADFFAKENSLDDSILLNSNGRIADTSRANIFLIRNGRVFTPSLTEGCVDGVMRSWLKFKLEQEIIETVVSLDDLNSATEVFLTNAIFGIRWVKSFRNNTYTGAHSKKIYSEFISTIFS
jgi:branched-chain amino acid aminotransferase